MRAIVLALALLAALVIAGQGDRTAVALAATCSDHRTQADAQRAADTRDGDGDGIYCESLPCPCLKPGQSSGGGGGSSGAQRGCVKARRVQSVGFSATKYPTIHAHFRRAVEAGWPRTLVVNRRGADARRDRLLEDVPTRARHDRDEYPPAVGRGRGKGLTRGASPRGWKASVAYVPSSENRSHGSVLGIKLRRFCDGTRFRYVFH